MAAVYHMGHVPALSVGAQCCYETLAVNLRGSVMRTSGAGFIRGEEFLD